MATNVQSFFYSCHVLHQLGFSPHQCLRSRTPGVYWWLCFGGVSPAVGLCTTVMLVDNSLRAATEGSLISQTQSQINGLVAEFRHWVSFDNQSREPLQKVSSNTEKSKEQIKIATRSAICRGAASKVSQLNNEIVGTFLILKHFCKTTNKPYWLLFGQAVPACYPQPDQRKRLMIC